MKALWSGNSWTRTRSATIEAPPFPFIQPGGALAFWLISFMSDILTNSKARRDYHILESFEAGIVLRGTEVKALRAGNGQIRDAFVQIVNGQAWLCNAHIEEYSHGNLMNHKPRAERRLLLHKSEIRKLFDASDVKGNTIIPLGLYWKNNHIKVKIGVGRGKVQFDKRQDLKERDSDRELKRALMHRTKGK